VYEQRLAEALPITIN